FGAIASVAAALTAVYTAFLFAQAKGRDYWQNPLLVIEMLADAIVAGIAVLSLLPAGIGIPEPAARLWLDLGLASLAVTLIAEHTMMHQTKNAAQAAQVMLYGEYRWRFWVDVVIAGLLAPALLLIFGGSVLVAAMLLVF